VSLTGGTSHENVDPADFRSDSLLLGCRVGTDCAIEDARHVSSGEVRLREVQRIHVGSGRILLHREDDVGPLITASRGFGDAETEAASTAEEIY
jgi:hypothetical protein